MLSITSVIIMRFKWKEIRFRPSPGPGLAEQAREEGRVPQEEDAASSARLLPKAGVPGAPRTCSSGWDAHARTPATLPSHRTRSAQTGHDCAPRGQLDTSGDVSGRHDGDGGVAPAPVGEGLDAARRPPRTGRARSPASPSPKCPQGQAEDARESQGQPRWRRAVPGRGSHWLCHPSCSPAGRAGDRRGEETG